MVGRLKGPRPARFRNFLVTFPDNWTVKQAEMAGRFVIAFNQLEFVLYLTQTRILAVSWKNYWTWQREIDTIDKKLQAIRAAYQTSYGAPLPKEWEDRLREVKVLAEERNLIVHGVWCERKGKRERRKLGKGYPITPRRWGTMLKRIQSLRDTFGGEYWKDKKPRKGKPYWS